MTVRARIGVGAFFLVTALLLVWGGGGRRGDATALALAYLGGRGREVRELEAPVEGDSPAGVLLVALPGARTWTQEEVPGLLAWVRAGGRVVLLPSPNESVPDALEGAFGLEARARVAKEPGTYAEWSAQSERATTLTGPVGEVRVAESDWIVPCPDGSDVAYRDGDGNGRICTLRFGAGSVMVAADTSVFGADCLSLSDNLALLEATFPEGATVLVDDHQRRGAAAADPELAGVLDAVLAQAALVYVLVLLQRAVPLGPPRPRTAERMPGLVRELRALGQLHAAAGHTVPAARRLLELAATRFAGDERVAALPHPDAVHTPADAIAAAAAVSNLDLPNLERRPS